MTSELSLADQKRLREADVAIMQMAADYLRRMPISPATYEVIQTIERHLRETVSASSLQQTLKGELRAAVGVSLLDVTVTGDKAWISLSEPPESWTKHRVAFNLIRALESSDEPLVVDLVPDQPLGRF